MSRDQRWVRNSSETWASIGLLAFVTLVTYGALVPQLGFYRDDWYLLWTAQALGSDGIVALFQSDRPLIGFLYALDYSLLGPSPLGWHVYALVVRLIANLAFLWLVRLTWPEPRTETTALALLFAVYPGFASQPNAGVYVNLLLASAAAILSFALTAAAIRSTRTELRVLYTALAVLLALFYLGIFESMVGLEAARPALIWYLLWQRDPRDQKSLLRRTFIHALPFALLAAGFTFWRLFIFQSTRHATNLGFLAEEFRALPLRSFFSVLFETLKDGIETTFFAWVVPFYRFTATANYRDFAAALLAALIVAAAAGAYFWRMNSVKAEASGLDTRRYMHAWLIGGWTVLAALLPLNAAGRNVLFEGQWDRYALPGAGGVALVVGGLLFHHFRGAARQVVLLTLIAMSVVVHFFSAASYRDFWSSTRELWWQMMWRAPSLQRGTMLFVPASEYAEGYEIYAPANLIYYPGEASLQIGAEVLNSETAAYLQAQKSLEHYDRSVLVPDNYDRSLIAVFPSTDSCLHVLDGRKIELPNLLDGTLVSLVATNSRMEQIDPNRNGFSIPAFLGTEPDHTWCFYYQRMNLARQQEDWEQVARLMDEALGEDLSPEDFSEWMPALEAYATLGRIKDARHAASIIRIDVPTRFLLCSELRKGPAYVAPYDYVTVRDLVCGETK